MRSFSGARKTVQATSGIALRREESVQGKGSSLLRGQTGKVSANGKRATKGGGTELNFSSRGGKAHISKGADRRGGEFEWSPSSRKLKYSDSLDGT